MGLLLVITLVLLNLFTVPVVSMVMEISSSLSLLESLDTVEAVAIGVTDDS